MCPQSVLVGAARRLGRVPTPEHGREAEALRRSADEEKSLAARLIATCAERTYDGGAQAVYDRVGGMREPIVYSLPTDR